jgi:AcrR family transcriptional regulator
MPERLSRQEAKGQTREKLLDAASQVFADRGFEAATIDEVAAAAGYTKGAVYSNFSSKTDLFLALLERRIKIESSRQNAWIAGHSPAEIADILEESTRQPLNWDLRWTMLFTEFWLHAMRDPEARQVLASEYERARNLVTDLIAETYEQAGLTPPFPARDMAILIDALGHGIGLQAALDPERVDMRLQAQTLVWMLRGGNRRSDE